MNQKYRNYIMWALYAVLMLVIILMQTTVFGRVRFHGVKLSLLPVAMVCIGMQVGHEAGGLFGLLAGLFWYAFGAESGTLSIVTFTLTGVLSGWLCDNVFARRFLPALGLSLCALLFHEGLWFVLKFYLENAPMALIRWVPITTGLSLLTCPVIYLLAKAVRKAGVPA